MKVRLNKYLSQCGVTSRRKADELIKNGKISVNNEVVKQLGISINPSRDLVFIGKKRAEQRKKRYIILNKPRLYLTTLINNEDNKPTITELIKDVQDRVYPTGRLDYDAEGLVFLTNDGELANRVHHPKYNVKKTYQVKGKGTIQSQTIKRIQKGVLLDSKFIKPDFFKVTHLKNGQLQITITFHEGKRHLVKDYLGYFGLQVEKLKRTSIGNLTLNKLPKGHWRDLTDEEVNLLKKKTGIAHSDEEI